MTHRSNIVPLRPCKFCGYAFDQRAAGPFGCPNCLGEGLESTKVPPDRDLPGCAGSCDQGRRPCPHPELCMGMGDLWDVVRWLLWPVVLILLVWAGIALWRAYPWLL